VVLESDDAVAHAQVVLVLDRVVDELYEF
jgi:hypothetical protein